MSKPLAQEIAEQSIVLLKNENHLLPLPMGGKIAVFGRGQIKTVFSGNGSGASRGQGTAILDALEAAGLAASPKLAAFYRERASGDEDSSIDWDLLEKTGNSGLAYELFGQYHPPAKEYPVPEDALMEARTYTDTALLILSRNSGGEECDRRIEDDYLLTDSEQGLVEAICGAFEKVVLILNVNGQIDLGWLETHPQIQSILFLGIPGEDGAAALAGILTGVVNPSGKLSFSVFRRYEECPTARDFSFDRDAPLCYEDYGIPHDRGNFDLCPVTVYREGGHLGYRTLGAPPLYPFGFGLSYTSFRIERPDSDTAIVTNIGPVPGRETVLWYDEQAVPKLRGFAKTALLPPGGSEMLRIPGPEKPNQANAPDLVLPDLTVEELAALCVGYGPGIPFSALSREKLPETISRENGEPFTVNDHPTGVNGYVSPAIPEKGIHSVSFKDGPAGVGGVVWPTAMLMACSFDRRLWYAFGNAVGAECEALGVDVWLAPAVNLHRNPLCGRNFEYFSEDPLLTGTAAVAIARGVQENHPVLVCPKHFVCNEQETYRRGSAKRNVDAVDSIVDDVTLREVYLKPFEMLVKEAGIGCIMTSFNKVNGVFAAGSRDLCTRILREEWGFRGCVVTDWGDMDTVVDGADAVAAGNDVVMPGGPPVIRQILNGYQEGRVTRADMETAVKHLLEMVRRTSR